MPAILPDEEAVSAWLNQDLHGFEALKILQPVEKIAVCIICNQKYFSAQLRKTRPKLAN